MSKKKANNEKLGALGEAIARAWFEQHGYIVTNATSKWDSEKDFFAEKDGIKYLVEVKTQVPWYKQFAFTIDPSQRDKCTGADFMFFVEVPTDLNGMKLKAYLFQKGLEPREQKLTKKNKTMLLYDYVLGDLLFEYGLDSEPHKNLILEMNDLHESRYTK